MWWIPSSFEIILEWVEGVLRETSGLIPSHRWLDSIAFRFIKYRGFKHSKTFVTSSLPNQSELLWVKHSGCVCVCVCNGSPYMNWQWNHSFIFLLWVTINYKTITTIRAFASFGSIQPLHFLKCINVHPSVITSVAVLKFAFKPKTNVKNKSLTYQLERKWIKASLNSSYKTISSGIHQKQYDKYKAGNQPKTINLSWGYLDHVKKTFHRTLKYKQI